VKQFSRVGKVHGGNGPRDADLDEASSQLSEGLKMCRSVIDNYRSMLSGEIAAANGNGARPSKGLDHAAMVQNVRLNASSAEGE
jgi:hypothetical protein